MLSAMINSHPELLSTSEEPFLLYFYHAYKDKCVYTEKEIDELIENFKLTAEKNLDLYFSSIESFKENLLEEKENLPFEKLCRIIYLNFIPLKPKDRISHIVDKQIKYILYIDDIIRIFPNAKIVLLVRDYHDVIASWRKRGLGGGREVAYIAEIWRISYQKAWDAIQKYPNKILLVKYEELVNDPEKRLKEIAKYFEFTYHNMMVNHHENFMEYIENMRSNVSDEFLTRLKDFHSNTLSPVKTDLIGEWKKNLNTDEVSIIENICGEIGTKYGYSISGNVNKLTWGEKMAVVKARFNKLIYLDVYIRVPLKIKVWIKRFRPNKIQE